jgi:hypothetical protein
VLDIALPAQHLEFDHTGDEALALPGSAPYQTEALGGQEAK